MRLMRRNSLLLVYVKVKGIRFPIVVPLPLAVAEELLRAMVVVAWLFNGVTSGGLAQERLRRLGPPRRIVLNLPEPVRELIPGSICIEPWRIVAGARRAVAELRSIGPFNLVDVQTPDAQVSIRLV